MQLPKLCMFMVTALGTVIHYLYLIFFFVLSIGVHQALSWLALAFWVRQQRDAVALISGPPSGRQAKCRHAGQLCLSIECPPLNGHNIINLLYRDQSHTPKQNRNQKYIFLFIFIILFFWSTLSANIFGVPHNWSDKQLSRWLVLFCFGFVMVLLV